jgi:tripartite-type tricarboxylate transporter receptor subunit TctC
MRLLPALIMLMLGAIAGIKTVVAQTYPLKPVRVVVSFAPGGSLDLAARLLAPKMSESLGQPVVVENRAGAGGFIGADVVAKSAGDGYTLLFTTPATHVIGAFLSKSMPYDPVRDFTPVTIAVDTMLSIAVHPSFPANTLAELIDYARRNPGKVSYGTSGIGTAYHFAGEQLKFLNGIDMVHVPYKGSGPSTADAIAGQIPVLFTGLDQALTHAKTGRLRLLGLIANRSFAPMPELPALAEVVPGFEKPPSWHAYFAPAGMPAPILARVHGEIVKAMNQPEVKDKLEAAVFLIVGNTPEQFSAQLKSEVERMAKVAKAAGIKPE